MYKNYDMDVNYYVPALVLSRLCTLHRTHRARTSEPLSRQNETRRESDTLTAATHVAAGHRCIGNLPGIHMFSKIRETSHEKTESGDTRP
jgi:hypothetical protein